jgi:hypothetical protein
MNTKLIIIVVILVVVGVGIGANIVLTGDAESKSDNVAIIRNDVTTFIKDYDYCRNRWEFSVRWDRDGLNRKKTPEGCDPAKFPSER